MSSARIVALVSIAGAVALGAAGWWLLGPDRAELVDSPSSADRVSEARLDPLPSPATSEAPGSPASTELDVATVDRSAESPERRVGPTLVVLEKETGKPLPDAAVTLLPRDQVSDEEWKGLVGNEPERDGALARAGEPVELDAQASATLRWSEIEALICADLADRHARRAVRLDAETRIVLRLGRREALTVATVDPDGRPQRDVPVSLQSLSRDEKEGWRPPALLVWRAATDLDGEAVMPRGSELLESHLDADGLASEVAVVAALAFPCRDAGPVLVDARHSGRAFVRVVTPPRSTLKLRVESAEPDAPFPDAVEVRAAAAGKPAERLPVLREWSVKIAAGAAAELTVEAGIAVELAATSADGRFFAERQTVTTPDRAESGEVTIRMQPLPEPPRCTVHVVAPGNRIADGAEIAWQLTSYGSDPPFRLDDVAPNARRLQFARADAEGAIRIESATLAAFTHRTLDESRKQRRRSTCYLELFLELDRPRPVGARYAGAIELPAIDSAESRDLGRVELVEVPLLLAGHVVDGAQRGIDQVELTIREAVESGGKGWSARTDRDGSFALHARSRAPGLAVWPSKEHWYRIDEYRGSGERDELGLAIGSSDVVIVLHRQGFVRGRLLVEPGISIATLFFDEQPLPGPRLRSRLDPDGRFEIEAQPGSWPVVLRSRLGAEEPVAEIDGVLLEEGKETVDPRLDPIDLRRRLQQVELDVHDADGNPIGGAALYLTRNRRSVTSTDPLFLVAVPRATDPFGRALVTTPLFDSWIVVGSPRHFFQSRTFEPAFQQVELAPAATVVVKVDGPAERLLERKDFLPTLSLVRAEGGAAFERIWAKLERPRLRRLDARTFEVRATMAGRYELLWKRSSGDRDREALWRGQRVDVASPRRLDLTEKLSERDVSQILSRLGR